MTTLKSIKEKAEKEFKDRFTFRGEEPEFWHKWNSRGKYPLEVLKWFLFYLDLVFKAGQEEERKKRNKSISNYRNNKHKKGICWDCSKKAVNSFYCKYHAEKSKIRKLKRYHKVKNLK